MDFPELAKLAFSRVQQMEPRDVGKILGCILLREPDEEEMVQLAYGTDAAVHAKISDAKATLAAISAAGGYYYAAAAEDAFHNGGAGAGGGLPPRAAARRANGLSTRRPCTFFTKGVCKHGQNCNFAHHQAYSDGFSDDSHHSGGGGGGTPGALEKLEVEITELLNSRHGQPLSIASLPTLYGERYGKGLQADGYLTESQRHGKAGYSLTKLLSRLNKIRVIERPHGQHSVVLAEDAARYTEFRGERGGGDMGSVPASSHQIYLTFPAESKFVEEDVATYFGQYGPVRDVRIPCQERRMFGFVSFQNPETVSTILMRRNPHFICGSRVLVKPYREKSKCIERTYVDKMKPMHYYPTRFFEIDPDFYPDEYEASSRMVRKQLAEKRERLIELERKRFAGVRLEPLPHQFAYFDCSIEDVNPLNGLPADSKDVDLMDRPLIVPDSLDVVSTSQAPQTQATNNYDDKESNQIELLPESPFASAAPAGNSISAII